MGDGMVIGENTFASVDRFIFSDNERCGLLMAGISLRADSIDAGEDVAEDIGEDVAEDIGEDIGAVGAVGESHGFANVQVRGNNQNMSFERIEIPSFSMFAF